MESTPELARAEAAAAAFRPSRRLIFSRLDRYIAREITRQFSISIVTLTLILLSGPLLEYVEFIARKGLPLTELGYLLGLTLPAMLAVALPIGFLLAVLVAFSRMGADMELAAIRTLGWSLKRMAVPVLGMGILVAGLTFLITAFGMPWANRRLRLTLVELSLRRSFASLQPGVFFTDLPAAILYVQDIDPKTGQWRRVLFIDRRDPEVRRVIMAREAYIRELPGHVPRVELRFRHGSMYSLAYERPREYQIAVFDAHTTSLSLGEPVSPETFPKGDREMTLAELRAVLHSRPRGDLYRQSVAVEYHKRWAIPLAAIVFVLIGYPLSVRHVRGSRFYGYAVGIGIILVAYAGILIGEHLGDHGKIPAWLAAWNPHLMLGIPGLILFWQLDRPAIRSGWLFPLRMPWERRRFHPPRGPAVDVGRWTGLTIIDRYLLRTWIRYFVIISIAFLVIYLIVEAFHLVDDMVRSGAPMRDLFRYLMFAAPGFFHQLLPVVLIMSIMVTIAVLEKFREVTALKAHGISYYRIMAPLMGATVAVGVLDFGLQERILPWTSQLAAITKSVVKGRPIQSGLAARWVFGRRAYLYHFDAYDVNHQVMYGFDAYGLDLKAWRISWHCQARFARYQPETGWTLREGWCQHFVPHMHFRSFSTTRARFPETPEYFATIQKTTDQMSIRELRQYIQELRHKGFRTQLWEVALAMKWVTPLAGLALFPLAVALALYGAAFGTAYGLVVALVIGFLHWTLTQLALVMGQMEIFSPWTAAVLPFLFTLMVGLVWFTRIRT